MRLLLRATSILGLLAAVAALAAAPVLAGNFADVTIVEGGEAPPVAGEERELRFLLLQHGVTPVDHGTVDVVATLPGTDEEIVLPATYAGDGVWTATITFPESGAWEIGVTHSVFETSAAMPLTVASAPGSTVPASWPIPALLLAAAAALLAIGAWVSQRGRRAVAPSPKALRTG
jgi:hypothetical protein